MGVDMQITQGTTLVTFSDGELAQVRVGLPHPHEVGISYTTMNQLVDLALSCGFEAAGMEREDYCMEIKGAAALADFADALERGLSVISPRPLSWEETGGPGTGRAHVIGQLTHVAPEAWLAGRESMVRAVIASCRWAIPFETLRPDEPVWLTFI